MKRWILIWAMTTLMCGMALAQGARVCHKGDGSYIVISKTQLLLRVYDKQDKVLAEFPVCVGRTKGNKQRRGDMKTPESPKGKPFKITQIVDASSWYHDFKDGRGSIKAYGQWFLRLATPPFTSIGIHGSTGNEWSIPGSTLPVPQGRTRGRDSEGCVRLTDKDVITLKEKYAWVGMPVSITPEGE